MTNSVPGTSSPAVTAMSTGRPAIAPSSSYASVLSGQARLGFSSHANATGTGNGSRISSHYSTSGSYAHGQQPPAQAPTVPSYLTESLYAERLASRTSSVFNPLPTPPSSLAPRKTLSHRFDVVEHAPSEEEPLSPLPTRWSETDRSPNIELLNNGSEARLVLIGPGKVNDQDAAAVRADRPMPPQCGLFYFEVTIVSKGKEGFIGIGFCTGKANTNKLPGWEQDSWGYHGDDGNSFCCQGTRKPYGPKFTTNDVIGCGVNFRTKTAFFTKNGHNLGTAFRDINKGKLYPVVGMKKEREHVRVNFGQDRFIFDIDNYMRNEKSLTYEEINSHSTAALCPQLDETELIQALVSQYLAHDGYVKTARAFAEDVQKESRALDSNGAWPSINSLDPKGDADAVNRQKIRAAILDGDVDRALKLTNTFYPNVLKEKELLYFRLRRRKLVEMIRQVADTVHDGSATSRRGRDDRVDDVFAQDMEIDDPANGASDWEKMDVEDGDLGGARVGDVKTALDAAVEYGQKLRIEFSSDTRPEIKKPLEEAFSLLAYTDPSNSVMAHLLDEDGRIADAEELNSAILVSLGKSSVAALERLIKQSTVLIQDISRDGGPGAFVNLRTDYLKEPQPYY